MGALTGAMTTTAYYTKGTRPDDFRDQYLEALTKHRFREIDLNTDHTESMGWVSAHDAFDTAFDLNKVLWGNYYVISFRWDRIRIPANTLKMYIGQASRERMESLGKETLTRDEKDEIKDMVEKQLRRRILPSIQIYDVVWSLDRDMAWVFTGSKTVNENIQTYFGDTFGFTMVPRTPYTEAGNAGLSAEELERMTLLDPTVFAVSAGR